VILYRKEPGRFGRTFYLSRSKWRFQTGPMEVEHAPGQRMVLTGMRADLHRWTEDPDQAEQFTSTDKARRFAWQQARIVDSRIFALDMAEDRDPANTRPDLRRYLSQWAEEYRSAHTLPV
jgi:hypothetical protein